MGNIYSVADLIGKTLFAKEEIPLYRTTGAYYAGQNPIYMVKPGQAIGVMDTWLQIGQDMWFLYYDSYKNLYVSKFESGKYDSKKMQAQGVKTEQQKVKEAEQAGLKWWEKIFNKENLFITGGIILAATAIKNKVWK